MGGFDLHQCEIDTELYDHVGDALGYSTEGLSRTRIKRLYKGHWRHCFLFGCGVVSDDTDHSQDQEDCHDT